MSLVSLKFETLVPGTDELVLYALIPNNDVMLATYVPRGTTLREAARPLFIDIRAARSEWMDYVLTGYEDVRGLDVHWLKACFCKNYDATNPAAPVSTKTGSRFHGWPDVLLGDLDFHFSLNLPLIVSDAYAGKRAFVTWKMKLGGDFKSPTTTRIYLSNNGNFTGLLRDDPMPIPGELMWDYPGHSRILRCLHTKQIIPARPATYPVSEGVIGELNDDAGTSRVCEATNRTDWTSFSFPATPQQHPSGIWRLDIETVDPPSGGSIIRDYE